MRNDFKNQLLSFLNKAKKELSAIEETQKPEDTITAISVINTQCLTILDFVFNYYSLIKDKYYFPRPKSSRTKDYKQIISNRLVESKNQNNSELKHFLESCFNVIKKNNWSIRFLDGNMKHRIEKIPNINKKFKTHLEYKGIGSPPILDKGNLHIPGLGQFSKGSNIHMSGVVISGPTNVALIEKLDFYPIWISGRYISFDDNGTIVKKNLKSWLKSCVKTCEEIVDII